LSYGDDVNVIGTTNSSWTKVRVSYYDGYSIKSTIGYVYSDYISTNNPLFDNSDYSEYNTNSTYNSRSSNNPYSASPYGYNKGKLTLWTDCPDDGQISVYIDGDYKGLIKQYFDSDSPDCGDNGTLGLILSAGTYKLTASGQRNKWEGYITVAADNCRIQKLAK
jgi:hypothetical protein